MLAKQYLLNYPYAFSDKDMFHDTTEHTCASTSIYVLNMELLPRSTCSDSNDYKHSTPLGSIFSTRPQRGRMFVEKL